MHELIELIGQGLGTLVMFGIVGLLIWWAQTPSEAIGNKIAHALEGQGLSLVDVSIDSQPSVYGWRPIIYVARARNVFGNLETRRFEVSRWENALSRSPTIREI